MLLGLTDALTAHHSVFYFMSLEVEEGFYFNVLVIPGVQFLEFPLSQKKRSHF